MPATLVSPTYSFVNFNQSPADGCCDGANTACLPVVEETDLAFQFKIINGSVTESAVMYDMPLTSFQLVLLRGVGNISLPPLVNLVRNWTVADGLLFEKVRTGTNEITFLWKHNLKDIKTLLGCDACFELGIYIPGIDLGGPVQSILAISNCFIRSCSSCYTAVLEYSSSENSFDFKYCNIDFANKVRLNFYLLNPSYPDDKSVYFKSNGRPIVTRAVYKKEYDLETDYFPESLHDKIKAAFDHDFTFITDDKYTGEISKSAAYAPEWVDDMCTAVAKTKVTAIATTMQNDNCGDCCVPVSVADFDLLPADIDSVYNYLFPINGTPSFAVAILNKPGWLTISIYNGQLRFNGNPASGDTGEAVAISFKVLNDCGEQTINRTLDVGDFCNGINDLTISRAGPTYANFGWGVDLPAPIDGCDWEVRDDSDAVIDSGTATGPGLFFDPEATGLTPATHYTFRVRSNCGDGIYSPWVELEFDTQAESGSTPGDVTLNCSGGSQDPITFGVAGIYNFSLNIASITTPGTVNVVAFNDQAGSLSGHSMYFSGPKVIAPGDTVINIPMQYDGGGVNSGYTVTYQVTDTSGTDSCEALFSFD